MDGDTTKKSPSLEKLVIQNITNSKELKRKLLEISKQGQGFEYDISECIQNLLTTSDIEILTLTLQAIAELSKCEHKRVTYAKKEIIEPILNILSKDVHEDNAELLKQGCRALGNLCCDCDKGRKAIMEVNGVSIMVDLLKKSIDDNSVKTNEVKILIAKAIINFIIGGLEVTQALVDHGLEDVIRRILYNEVEKTDMNVEAVSICFIILGVIIDTITDYVCCDDVNKVVLKVLKETCNVEISEYCFEHLQSQAEHDSVKTLLAREGCVELLSSRLERLVSQQVVGDHHADDADVTAVMKQACELIVVILTGDEAMHLLYANGTGSAYQSMVRWLRSPHEELVSTAVLAIGNFARQDDYCHLLMEAGIFDTLLDLFEKYHRLNTELPETADHLTLPIKLEHGILSTLRNILVAPANKKCSKVGRAVPMFISALPEVKDHNVAFKLLGAMRMIVDGPENISSGLLSNDGCLAAISTWARGGGAGAGGEAPRLLAAALVRAPTCNVLRIDGCVECLVNMLVLSHSIMQNEAIVALTILTVQVTQNPHYAMEFSTQLIKSEIGKHLAVLVNTSCAKMPLEVAQNIIVFLELACKNMILLEDFKEARVYECLKKLLGNRVDVNKDLNYRIENIIVTLIRDEMFDGFEE